MAACTDAADSAFDDLQHARAHQLRDKLNRILAKLRTEMYSEFEAELAPVTKASKSGNDEALFPTVRSCSAGLSLGDSCPASGIGIAVGVSKDLVSNSPRKPDVQMASRNGTRVNPEALHFAAPSEETVTKKWSLGAQLDAVAKNLSFHQQRSGRRSPCIWMESDIGACAWNIFMMFFIILAAWNDTLGLAQDWNDTGSGPLGEDFDKVVLFVFVFDIIFQFNIGYENEAGEFIATRRLIGRSYMKTWFVFDLMVTIPYDRILSRGQQLRSARIAKLFKLLRAARLLKIYKIFMSSNRVASLTELLDDFVSRIFGYGAIIKILEKCRLFGVLALCCAILFVESHIVVCILLSKGTKGNLYFEFQNLGSDALDPWLRYFVVLRWVLVGCATGIAEDFSLRFIVSHIDPQILQIMLIVLFSCNFTCILAVFSNLKSTDEMDSEFRLRALDHYLRKVRQVSHYSRKSILQYLRNQSMQGKKKHLLTCFDEIPHDLQLRVGFERFADLICQFPLFQQGPFQDMATRQAFLLRICHSLESRFSVPMEVLVTGGTNFEGLFCAFTGSLEKVEAQDDSLSGLGCTREDHDNTSASDITVFRTPCFFGAQALFAPLSRRWQSSRTTYYARTTVESVVLRRLVFDNVIQADDEWSLYVRFLRSKVANETIVVDTLSASGLSQEMLEEYRGNFKACGGSISSNDLGISATYLCNMFENDLKAQIDTIDTQETCFYDLRDLFWGAEHCGFKGSAELICPRDGRQGCAIVDALDSPSKGKANYFISWCWAYTVDTVISAISCWTADYSRNASTLFLWMCFFCNNQRALLIEGESNSLADTFQEHLEKIGHMVVLLNDLCNTMYTTRLWCIYETYTAKIANIPLEVALPLVAEQEFRVILKSKGGVTTMIEALTNIDVEGASASHEEDRKTIVELIKSSIGFTGVNEAVKGALLKWLALEFENCLVEEVSPHAHRDNNSDDRVQSEENV